MTEQEAYEHALELVERNTDGTFDEKKLLDLMIEVLEFDEAEARRAKAKRVVNRMRRPGATKSTDGQLIMFDTTPYDYEPERLVATDEHTAIEQKKALPEHKAAEAQRVSRKTEDLQRWERRRQNETIAFYKWANEKIAEGMKREEVVFDRFIKDPNVGAWLPPVEPSDDPDDPDDGDLVAA